LESRQANGPLRNDKEQKKKGREELFVNKDKTIEERDLTAIYHRFIFSWCPMTILSFIPLNFRILPSFGGS